MSGRGNGKRRYCAELMFQFRVVIDGESSKVRLCERRVVELKSDSPEAAYQRALQVGNEAEVEYVNDEGNPVRFEFVGVMELLGMSAFSESEVWFSLHRELLPMERKAKWIPSKRNLSAFREREA